MFERFTEKARRVIFFARYEASQYGAEEISTEHLLLGLMREGQSLFLPYLNASDTLESIRAEIEVQFPRRESVGSSVDLPLNSDAKAVLMRAKGEAEDLGHKHIGTEHLLIGLLQQECIARNVLQKHNMEAAKMRARISEAPSPRSGKVSPYNVPLRAISREAIVIHGIQHPAETIRSRVAECRAFSWYWRPQQWTSRDLAVERSTGQISFDLSLLENNEAFDVAEKAWKYDLCVICHWKLEQSPQGEHSTGYTNGRDWVCVECYEKFLKRADYFQSGYGDIT